MSKVSVILTSFNHEKYIREAIDSVLNQSFTDFELIIWDDASIDDSWSVINSYSDTRIKAFRNEETKRGIYGINKAISEVATGEYIAIHHSDDVWEPEKLSKQVAFLDKHTKIGAVFTKVSLIDHRGQLIENPMHPYQVVFDQPNRTRYAWLNHFFCHGNALCHPSVLIRKECYSDCGPYRLGLAQLGDFDMWIRLCLKYEIHILQDRLVRFRQLENEQNTSGNRPEANIRLRFEFFNLLQNYRSIGTFKELVKIFPGAEKFDCGGESDIDFALAMIALEAKPFVFTELFGQELLLEIIWNPERAARIKRAYDFDYIKFIQITGKHDVFSQERIRGLNQAVQDKDVHIGNLEQVIGTFEVSSREREAQIANLAQAVHAKDVHIGNLDEVISNLEVSSREHEAQIANLAQAVHDKDVHISNLEGAAREHEAHIANLEQAVQDKDVHIGNLEGAATEREAQIANLARAVAERDQALAASSTQITSLGQGITERDRQIAELNQGMAERDQALTTSSTQIANLAQAVHDKDVRIGNLEEAIGNLEVASREHEAHIANLAQAVAERDRDIEFFTTERNKLNEAISFAVKKRGP